MFFTSRRRLWPIRTGHWWTTCLPGISPLHLSTIAPRFWLVDDFCQVWESERATFVVRSRDVEAWQEIRHTTLHAGTEAIANEWPDNEDSGWGSHCAHGATNKGLELPIVRNTTFHALCREFGVWNTNYQARHNLGHVLWKQSEDADARETRGNNCVSNNRLTINSNSKRLEQILEKQGQQGGPFQICRERSGRIVIEPCWRSCVLHPPRITWPSGIIHAIQTFRTSCPATTNKPTRAFSFTYLTVHNEAIIKYT